MIILTKFVQAMKITFIGATHEVTGSCTLLEVGEKYYIVPQSAILLVERDDFE